VLVSPQFAKAIRKACKTTGKPKLAQFIDHIKYRDIEDREKGLCLLFNQEDIRTWQSGLEALQDDVDDFFQVSEIIKKLPERTQQLYSNAMVEYQKAQPQSRQ